MAPSPSSSTTTSVQVALRIRPPTQQDSTSIPARFQRPVIHAASSTSVAVEPSSSATSGAGAPASVSAVSSSAAGKKQHFSFDQVHGPSTTQHSLFTSTALPLISRFVEGFNCTILAYGQTSSGKTFTMTGIDLDADPSDPNNGMGIIPRAVSTIFGKARHMKEERGSNWNYSIKGSFIEIYNEDLIDLLGVDDSGGKREVQIREDKDGHIIWGGLREVSVKNAGEVMNLIRKGTSIRRTNETDMNAQSSRSHAIFSLTLTQKKFTGSGAPPRSSSPLPPNGRSPSRLARPGSVYTSNVPSSTTSRVGSPTFGRPPTPSFASAMGRSSGLRPSSALGHSGDRSISAADEDSGEWVTIVSKFHFVDLAGSERLKRTAAQGERIKEGISINGGLLALGNVISALGDPSRNKSNTATHIPYRDSKLTRLLQDSLGGNAHTLMIACVSPAEYNVGETVNTLKYANRARNIKNRAVVNEKEDGWEDVEWLQGTVTRLRKELKVIKDGGIPASRDAPAPEPLEGAGKKVLAQMTELQNNYEDLRGKFVERTEELTRLRRELGESHRNSASGAVTGTSKYEEIVGPVIEEYEKTIATMEAELSLNRAALRHTNEMVEEKEDELAAINERHSATELYVEELRSRVTKLTEREASTEAYVRDLEEKMKSYDESSITSSESMTDLKREVSKFRETESQSGKYILDLEARLARADESMITLQQTVERLEKDVEQRREEAELLQTRLDELQQDRDGWRSDLEAREVKLRALQEKLDHWEEKKKDAGDARVRLGNVVHEVASARRSLEVDLATASSSISPISHVNGHTKPVPESTEQYTALSEEVDTRIEPPDQPVEVDGPLRRDFNALQQTHTATLSDLSSVTSKYRDALREISDLAAQIQEAKLAGNGSEPSDSPPENAVELPAIRRRTPGGRVREATEPQYNAAGRRLFFRQAASAESLHSRSLSQSQSLSQELSSAHSRKTSFSSHGSSSHSPSTSASTLNSLMGSRPNLSLSLPTSAVPSFHERSVSSMETEIMRLQDVLKDRENEIATLEASVKAAQSSQSPLPAAVDVPPIHINGSDSLDSSATLSPKTRKQFDNIRKSMELKGNGHFLHDSLDGSERPVSSAYSEGDESLERLNELMLSMAQKESNHREVVDDLTTQLTGVRRQLDDLTALSRDQAINMSSEMELVRNQHAVDLQTLEDTRRHEAELVEALAKVQLDHEEALATLRHDHENVLSGKIAEVDALISRMKDEHESSYNALHNELIEVTSALEKARIEHEEAFGKLRDDHEEELKKCLKDASETLARSEEEHASTISKLTAKHTELLKTKEAEAAAALQQTEEDYYNALTKLRSDHASALETHSAEAAASLMRLKEEKAGELRMAEIAREGVLSESESSTASALQQLREEHDAAAQRKEISFKEDIEQLKVEHSRILETKEGDHRLEMDKVRAEHNGILAKLKEEWRIESDRLAAVAESLRQESSVTAEKARTDLENTVHELKTQQAKLLEEVTRGHNEELQRIEVSHVAAIEIFKVQTAGELDHALQAHVEESAKLRADHEAAIAILNESIVALQVEHASALESLRLQGDDALESEKARLHQFLEELKVEHAKEVETLQRDLDLQTEETKKHNAAIAISTSLQEAMQTSHDQAMREKSAAVQDMELQVSGYIAERDELAAAVAKLRGELDKTRNEQSQLIQEASKRESLVIELERHRSVLADLQENLQRVKDEKDTLQTEKTRSDSLVRELQAQIARSSSPPVPRPTPERNMSSFTRPAAGMKLPPPTPPPNVPPPPAPRSQHDAGQSISSQSSTVVTSSSSNRESQPESPSTSVGHTSTLISPGISDPKIAVRVEQQAKQIDEQEAMIKTLNKQLTHCESDLQTHMDLVSTLETSLGDSEKNLRKARMHATELARERDTLNNKVEALRIELSESKKEVVNARQSIVQEKQSYEQKLDEERRAKERARQQLDSRMEELTLKRKSKFACL